MSSARLARQRRANMQPEQAPPPPQPTKIPKSTQMTLPQMLQIIDARIGKLEMFMQESLNTDKNKTKDVDNEALSANLINEYESRFQLLATEVNDIKDTLIKLQTFTMDVNKKLLDDRDYLNKGNSDVQNMYVYHNINTQTDSEQNDNSLHNIGDDEQESSVDSSKVVNDEIIESNDEKGESGESAD